MSDSTATVCRCGQPTRDDAYVCDTCTAALATALGDVAWLEQELETTITRSRGVDYRTKGGTASSERPSPVVWSASDARRNLRGTLIAWVKFCHDNDIRNSSPTRGIPEGETPNPIALSRYLLWRVDGLALDPQGPAAVEQITTAVGDSGTVNRGPSGAYRIIDRYADKQYLGDCAECDGGRLYASPGGQWARCDLCGHAKDAEELRNGLLASLDDRLCTASEIARLSTYLGLKDDRATVRKRINQWHKRGRITSESMFDEPAFRFGIVWRLLQHEDDGKVA